MVILIGCVETTPVSGQDITLKIRSLGSGEPVANAIIDLQSCHIGKFRSDENGVVRFHTNVVDTCVLYISSSGYISLVRSFEIPDSRQDFEMVFYMQKQEQYKMGRILSAHSFIPIPDVHIYRMKEDGSQQLLGISDKRGIFGVVNYMSGEYRLIFKHPEYHTQEKTIFIRRDDGGLGSFYMRGHEPKSRLVEEKSPKLTGIASRKFSFLGSSEKYIIVLGLYKGRENLPTKTENSEIQFVEKGDWIRMFIGPYDTEKIALARLQEIREHYPQAILKSE